MIDVRNPGEWSQRRIEGAVNIPLSRLRASPPPRDGRQLVVHCASGYRSTIAASLLERDGAADVGVLVGGLAAWDAAALPVVEDQPAG